MAGEDWSDDEDDEPMPVHRLVPAAGRPPPETTGVRWIFDIGARLRHARGAAGRLKAAPGAARDSAPSTCSLGIAERTSRNADGHTVHAGLQYPSGRLTKADVEREIARRARQRPPKPKRLPKGVLLGHSAAADDA